MISSENLRFVILPGILGQALPKLICDSFSTIHQPESMFIFIFIYNAHFHDSQMARLWLLSSVLLDQQKHFQRA